MASIGRAGVSPRAASDQVRFDERRPPPKACAVLMPVWGAAYARQFLDCCLPTLLAAGNLPALARALPTRFVLLTQASDVAGIRAHPTWRQLAQCCDTEIATIDDLIVEGQHHASVTLAYTRALRAAGEAMRDTVFIFLVGDYLVADGSLFAAFERIQAGASGVLAGNLQIDADAAAALLRDRSPGATGELALPPRLLTGWALAHLPASTAAGIVNASLLHDSEATRMFWSVDDRTLLGRFYLLHMIAIRPELTEFVVGAPCDYAFIPELCPSGKVDVLTDSDHYLVAEMLRHDRGAAGLRWGTPRPQTLAPWLSQWTTVQHRRNAERTLLFHAGDVPQNIAAVEAAASTFVAEVRARLVPTPQPHRDHPFWIGMMALQRAATGPAAADADWAHLLGSRPATGSLTGLLWRLRLALLGYPPAVTICHPLWPDFHLAHGILGQGLRPTDRLLVVSAAPRRALEWLRPLCASIEGTKLEAIESAARQGATPAFDACFWIVIAGQAETAAFERLLPMVKPGSKLVIVLTAAPDAELIRIPAADAGLGLALQQSGTHVEQIHYVSAGSVRTRLARALSRIVRAGRRRPCRVLPLVLAAGALTVAAIVGCNLALLGRSSKRPPRGHCSSILIAGRTAVAGANSAIDCPKAPGYDGPEFSPPARTGHARAGGSQSDRWAGRRG